MLISLHLSTIFVKQSKQYTLTMIFFNFSYHFLIEQNISARGIFLLGNTDTEVCSIIDSLLALWKLF